MKIFETREDLFNFFKKDLTVAEIGVFKGDFSKFIFENLQPKELFLVDIFEGYMGSGDKDGNNMQYTDMSVEFQKLKEHFVEFENVHIVKNRSSIFFQELEDEFLDLVYIDGDHEYESVVCDINLAFNKVKKGGLICGHDYISPRFEGVVRAVNEFCEQKGLNIEYMTKDGCPSYCIIKK